MDEQPKAINQFAIASLIIGIISFINLAGMEKAIVAIILGILALKSAARARQPQGKNLAIAGIILGAFAIIASTIFIVRILPVVTEQLQQMQGQQTQEQEAPASKLY